MHGLKFQADYYDLVSLTTFSRLYTILPCREGLRQNPQIGENKNKIKN